jgi:hypothetical protein
VVGAQSARDALDQQLPPGLNLQEMMRGYQGESSLLTPESFTAMMSPRFDDGEHRQGVFWEITARGNIGHSGSDPGVFAYLLFNPIRNHGQIFMANISIDEDEQMLRDFQEIWQALNRYGGH